MLRFLTAGESHGPALVVMVEGLPAGLPILVDDIGAELARRRLGYGRGPRMRFERDEVEFLGGVRHGRTLGSPVAIVIRNSEWPKWEEEMSSAPGRHREAAAPSPGPVTPTSSGMQKYGFDDARDVLERATARETAARVAAGALAKALLAHLGMSVLSHVVQLGAATVVARRAPADARRPRADRRVRGALLRPRRRGRDDPRDQGSGEGRRLARRRGRGARLRRAARARFARALGPPHRRAARAGADEHPGDEGRRDRRGLRPSRRARGSDAHDAIVWDAEAGEYRASRTARAASKAA